MGAETAALNSISADAEAADETAALIVLLPKQ
jgi:hypothetical protein